MDLKEAKAALSEINGSKFDPDDPGDQAGLVMIAALEVGPKVRAIAKFTGLPQKTVSGFVQRLRCNGVFTRNRIHANWFDPKEGGVAFICDVLVATGMLNRAHE